MSDRIQEITTKCEEGGIIRRIDVKYLLAQLATLQSENAALREAQRWIAVGAKLPKRSNYVMAVWNSEGVAWVGEAFYNATTKLFKTSFDQSTDHAITHWQPLPTAPQEGE